MCAYSGTGTKAGDPTEIRSIRTIFAANRTPEKPLYLTSIKANIGHAEAASGAASLAKLLLMLRNRTIPAVISLKNLNPNIRGLDEDHDHPDREHAVARAGRRQPPPRAPQQLRRGGLERGPYPRGT